MESSKAFTKLSTLMLLVIQAKKQYIIWVISQKSTLFLLSEIKAQQNLSWLQSLSIYIGAVTSYIVYSYVAKTDVKKNYCFTDSMNVCHLQSL